jgi:hypothetical protein
MLLETSGHSNLSTRFRTPIMCISSLNNEVGTTANFDDQVSIIACLAILYGLFQSMQILRRPLSEWQMHSSECID